ncbi:hypothetical protein NCER_102400 [Vairimorpha ceranae BRL01]|uniref:Uncharacterized protein n=1 Tax=Vairimorpha ceranae (strain BRL01) TaxID=578460 RepID=C4VBY7_VAIC1|nr:hypothetical protein NCER_102400 [Vairimorpha ceranae BRL01]
MKMNKQLNKSTSRCSNYEKHYKLLFSKFVQQNNHCSLHYLRSILKPHYHAIPFVYSSIKFKCWFVFFFYLNVIKFSFKSITVNIFDPCATCIISLIVDKLYGSFSTKSFKHISLLTILTSPFGLLIVLIEYLHSDTDFLIIPLFSKSTKYLFVFSFKLCSTN